MVYTKPHYEILDGLRGVAAIMVVAFHVMEAFATSRFDQILNHAHLAVDFFFVLSGFVIGYAYDDRWGKMSIGHFLKRRIFRLQPMVVFGTVLGVILFYFGASTVFPLIQQVPVWKVLIYALLGMLLIPTPPSMDIRGWQEMYTLDAPVWSLAFEYIANILYALFVRKFSKIALSILVFIAACATLYLSLKQGDLIGGWALDSHHLHVGFTRLIYPFFAGLLLYRMGQLIHLRRAFLWCSLLFIAVLVVPRIGGPETLWMNGLYEAAIVIIIFPLIVFMGASGEIKGKYTSKICKFLGDISYPLYLVNYPLCYIHTGWISDTKYTFTEAGWMPLLVFTASILLAYLALKLFDEPVRKWLRKFI
ncbi:MAG: acyltransferase [Dysgonamonadaceae bacterium]|jgi:peptidoglycan/LPS O-acetylase OafA/YrhL|nr:acyltransferase [Dysgonamonadaceae bacterium]